MRSSSSTSLLCTRSVGSVRLHSPPSCSSIHFSGLLDSAVEYLMVKKDFRSAFDTCEKGLENLCSVSDQEESCSRHGELKAAFCIVGIQALAEVNHWCGILEWVLKHYNEAERVPAKIMQMCILLYSKVGQQDTMQGVASAWLCCPNNTNQPGFCTVAELYLLHVLLPLSRTAEAQELLESEVGKTAFTEDQRQVAMDIVQSQFVHQRQTVNPNLEVNSGVTTTMITPQGASNHWMNAVIRQLYRGLSVARARASLGALRRTLLAFLLLYLLIVRMDPALPSSFPWIFRLLQVFRQIWDAMFGPYYKASGQN
ncbi:peroxisome assembly protein 26 [Chanos chanos]|uniref:Peroxisome assembly protein 26 n=1 Tax=Chanos chanos TaxID=29144 RepID=A0A6J2WAD0_CHACN|nr:peroxisome assembly protein 26 [Chanos chanos]